MSALGAVSYFIKAIAICRAVGRGRSPATTVPGYCANRFFPPDSLTCVTRMVRSDHARRSKVNIAHL
jgi:hypothetical protein